MNKGFETCVKCGKPRWYGPNGTNKYLTMCEDHQREYWRESKAAKAKPLGAILEDGTRRKPGKPRKDAPKPITDEKLKALMNNVEQEGEKTFPKFLKVVVVNRKLDVAQLIEVPVISDVRYSEIRRPDDLLRLLRGSGHIVVYADRDKA